MLFKQCILTGSTGESLGSRMEEEVEGVMAAVAGIAVRSLAVAACGDMAVTESTH